MEVYTPTRYRQIVETESTENLCLEGQKNISLDQKHSSQVARIYYQVDGQISMSKHFGGSRDTFDSLIKSMLYSEKSESDISKANLKEIKNSYCTDEEEDDVESLIPCAQVSPQIEIKMKDEETKACESNDDKNPTASNIVNMVKEFKNSERRTRVPFTPEEDSFVLKGIKKHGFGYWTAILRSFKDNFRGSRTVGRKKKKQKNYLANKNKFVCHKHVVHKLR